MKSEYKSNPQLQAHFQELERVLVRVECASTLYQVLGLERSDSAENMKVAYQKTVTLLNPLDVKHSHLDPNLEARIRGAIDKVANALSILTNLGKRVEYDKSLVNKDPRPPVAVPQPPEADPAPRRKSADVKQRAGSATDSEVINIQASRMHKAIYTKNAEQTRPTERRRFRRHKSRFPARVMGHDRAIGKWDEVAETTDVSKGGAALRMKRAVQEGMVLLLILPLPVKLRSHGFSEPFYRVYAIVRQVKQTSDEQWVVGLDFLGESPPAGYLDKPWATFKTAK